MGVREIIITVRHIDPNGTTDPIGSSIKDTYQDIVQNYTSTLGDYKYGKKRRLYIL